MENQEKPINEQICELMAEILTLESTAAEIRAEIAARKKDIRERIKDLGFDPKAFNKVLDDYRVLKDPNRKAKWMEQCEEVAKIQVALRQPTLFEMARDSGQDWAK